MSASSKSRGRVDAGDFKAGLPSDAEQRPTNTLSVVKGKYLPAAVAREVISFSSVLELFDLALLSKDMRVLVCSAIAAKIETIELPSVVPLFAVPGSIPPALREQFGRVCFVLRHCRRLCVLRAPGSDRGDDDEEEEVQKARRPPELKVQKVDKSAGAPSVAAGAEPKVQKVRRSPQPKVQKVEKGVGSSVAAAAAEKKKKGDDQLDGYSSEESDQDDDKGDDESSEDEENTVADTVDPFLLRPTPLAALLPDVLQRNPSLEVVCPDPFAAPTSTTLATVLAAAHCPRLVEMRPWAARSGQPQVEAALLRLIFSERAGEVPAIVSTKGYHEAAAGGLPEGVVPIFAKATPAALNALLSLPGGAEPGCFKSLLFWAVGVAGRSSPALRDQLLPVFARVFTADYAGRQRDYTLKCISGCIAGLCSGVPPPELKQAEKLLPVVELCMYSKDAGVITGALEAIAAVAGSGAVADRINTLIQRGMCRRLVELTMHRVPEIKLAALHCLIPLLSGDDECRGAVLHCALLPCLQALLWHVHRGVRALACEAVERVTRGSAEQLQAVLQANMVPTLVAMVSSGGRGGGSSKGSRELPAVMACAARALANLAESRVKEHVAYVFQQNAAPAFVTLLTSAAAAAASDDIVESALAFLLAVAKAPALRGAVIAVMTADRALKPRIQALTQHSNATIREPADALLKLL